MMEGSAKGLEDPIRPKDYWLKKTPAERLEEMARLRQEYFKTQGIEEPEFQKVITIRKLRSSG